MPLDNRIYSTLLSAEAVAASTWYLLIDLNDLVNYRHPGYLDDSGTATAVTATTLSDSSKAWTVDEHIGRVVFITANTGAGQRRLITDSDATSITVGTWTTNPDTTSKYAIYSAPLSVNVLHIDLEAEKATDGAYDIWVGVVRENDATNGSADWIHCFHLEASGNPTDSTDRFTRNVDYTCQGVNPGGLDCTVVDDRLIYMRGPSSGDQTALQNDAGDLGSAAGGTSKSAVAGDLVVWVEEASGAGTIDLALTCQYAVN